MEVIRILGKELKRKMEERLETYRRLDGELSVEVFSRMHLYCEATVPETLIKNSDKNDPASGDPIPEFGFRLHCNKHDVSSLMEMPPQLSEPQLVEETQGE
jgi:hypothetical protein